MFEVSLKWLIVNWVEVFGAVSGLVYIFLSIKQNILLWPIGFITSAAYIVVFFETTLYADMLLQVYYLVISVYGWYYWLKGKETADHKKSEPPIIKISLKLVFILLSATVLLSALFYFILKYYTNSTNPFADGTVTAGSVIATWMLARKLIENWLLWIIVDAGSIFLFLYKQLYPTAILFVIYTILAVVGYYEWKKKMQIQNEVQ
jgi:nicotinamide mononucleotide transporter